MSKKIETPPKDDLMKLYSQDDMSISKLARHYKTSHPTVRKWLIEHDIPRKTHVEVCRAVNKNRTAKRPDVSVLKRLYKDNSIKQLEKTFQCGQQTIYQWLDEYNIPRHSLSDSVKIAKEKQYSDIRFTKEQVLAVYDKTKHLKLAADELGISVAYLRSLKQKYNIDTHVPWRSQGEIDLFNFISTLDPNCRANDKSIINPFELDIVSDKYKLAIEYCGLYWHSEYYGGKSKAYHREKYLRCKEKGYSLYTIFESDDMQKVKQLLTQRLTSEYIGARKTKVVELTSGEAKKFHEKYHLHGSIGGSYHYGLTYNNQLMMVASFHKSRYNKKFDYECGRMTSGSIRVLGGVSKLFKHFHREVKPSSIITYSDLRFGDGDCYTHCDLERQSDSPPNYWYYYKNNPSQIFSRVSFQKHKLKDKLSEFNEDLTEYDNMVNNGWDRIWDCGNAVYTSKG